MKILPGDFENPQVLDLIRLHLKGMHENSPPGSVFALDLSGLLTADVSFYAAWDGDRLAGMGALKHLSPEAGEIKSMRTHPNHLRKGVAAELLEHVMSEAQSRGYSRLSLETGSGPAFGPALAMYRKYGFKPGPAFADYQASEFSQFLHLDL
ncbi:MAG: GNAT family N-acetyltransferase [Rhodobacteraceae bacterium]|nr:GNAT family N-acetyltransferase [Paracoccaceae bacterium]